MDHQNSYIFIKSRRELGYSISHEDLFYYFIENSHIELLSTDSAFGMVYACTFQGYSNKSPYFIVSNDGRMENVTKIVIKMVLTESIPYTNSKTCDIVWNYKDLSNNITTKSVNSVSDFFEECTIQKEVGLRTIRHNNRISPVLLFSKLYQYTSGAWQLLRLQLLKNSVTKKSRHSMDQFMRAFRIHRNRSYIGIIGMECIMCHQYKSYCDIIKPIIFDEIKSKPEYKDLYKHDNIRLARCSPRLRYIYNIARYELLRLAIDSGYTHGDYHTDNIWINEKKSRAILIDFGKTVKIKEIDTIRTLWTELLAGQESITSKIDCMIETPETDDTEIMNIQNSNDLLDYDTIVKIMSIIFAETFTDDKMHDEYRWCKMMEIEDTRQIINMHRNRVKYATLKNIGYLDDFLEEEELYIFDHIFTIDTKNTLYQRSRLLWYHLCS